MRVVALLAALLLAAGGLTGCIGAEKEDTNQDIDKNKVDVPAAGGTGATGAAGQLNIKVLAPLSSKVSFEGAQWVKTGSSVPVTATTPANAKGEVTYTWATGPLPGTSDVEQAADLDTKLIEPGQSASLTFAAAGNYLMHCHPHPFMLSNVTVIDGYTGPSKVEVLIIDGEDTNQYRYVPENIVVGVGTEVVYTNRGALPHTATLMEQSPALKLAQASGASANVTIDGEGWQRVLVVMQDSEGRIGLAETSIYATAELPTFEAQKIPFSFDFAGTPVAPAPGEAASPVSKSFTLEHSGTIFMNWTTTDASTTADVEIHLKEEGATQDTITGSGAEGSQSARAQGTTYTVTIVPKSGVSVSGEVVIEAVYDLIPPAPAKASADEGSDGGHGAHGGGGHDH